MKLKYLLGNTIEEAEATHAKFVEPINRIARVYAKRTGLDRRELVNEAFIALNKAILKHDERKGPLYPYAIRCIKFHLLDVLYKENHIYVPVYVAKATSLLNKIQELSESDIYYVIELYKSNSIDDKSQEIIGKLYKIADRAGISINELVRRVYATKIDLTVEEPTCTQLYTNITEMDKDLLFYYSSGTEKREIAYKIGKSVSWVEKRLKRLKDDLLNN